MTTSDNERDAVDEARALLAQIAPDEWTYDRYKETVSAPVGFMADIWTTQGDAPGQLIAAAPRLLRRLADECETLRAALAQRITTSGAPPVVDMTHYVPLDINVLRGNAAPEPPPRETGADGAQDETAS